MGKKGSLSTEKRAQIVTLNSIKFSLRQIEKKVKVSKTALHNTTMKYQNEGTFKDIEKFGRPRVISSREDRLMRTVVTCSPMSCSKKI